MVQATKVEAERRRRMQVCLWAYAYEEKNDSLVSDATFDRVCYEIDLSINTGNRKMDNWFKKHFDPCTGQWVGAHPDRKYLERMYNLIKSGKYKELPKKRVRERKPKKVIRERIRKKVRKR